MKFTLLIILYVVSLALIGQEYLLWFYLIQLKEYRIDRLKDYFTSLEGKIFFRKRVVYFLFFLVYVGILFGFEYLSKTQAISPEIAIIPLILFTLFIATQAWGLFRAIAKKQIRYPRPTLRIGAAMGATGALVLVLFLWQSLFVFTYIEASLLFFLATTLIFVGAGVVITQPISFMLKKRMVDQAKEKRNKYQDLIVIGITGSYGKTSVKEYLYWVLKDSFSTIKTEEHVNTEIGVAKTVLDKLTAEASVFIVEMGAYRKGEIRAIAEIVKPKIGIITAINHQHVSLFGSVEEIMKTKAELVFSLPKNGFAVLNKDNIYIQRIAKKLRVKKYFYSIDNEAHIRLDEVRQSEDGVLFSVIIAGKKHEFITSLHGKHTAQNLMPVILVALKLGVPIADIQKRIKSLKAPAENMEVLRDGEDVIVKNTYNLNPASIDAFLNLLPVYENRKNILILDDILELGDDAEEIHQTIAKKLVGRIDALILIGKNYPHVLAEVLEDTELSNVYITRDSDEIAGVLDEFSKKTVGFLGRGARKTFIDLYE